MSELIHNGDFAIPGPSAMEPAEGWTFQTADEGSRTTPAAAGILPPPSGNPFILEMHDLTSPPLSSVAQMGIPWIPGDNLVLNFNMYINPNGDFQGTEYFLNVAGNGSAPDLLVPNVWVPQSIPFTVLAGSTLNYALQSGGLPGRFAWLDNVSIIGAVVCYAADSQVLTKDIETGVIEEIDAIDVSPEKHQVFDVAGNVFIPVVKNLKTGPTKRYALLEKDCINPGLPNRDFRITKGHYVFVEGEEIKAGHLPQAKIIKAPEREYVYTICTEQRTIIQVNGLPCFTYTLENWNAYLARKN